MIKIFQGVLLILMLDCEQSARLTSESFDRSLTRLELTALWIHQKCCRNSDRVARQMEMVARAIQQQSVADSISLNDDLSEEARNRIRQRLRELAS